MEAFTGPFQVVRSQENQPPRFDSEQISGFDFGLQLSNLSADAKAPEREFFLIHTGAARHFIVSGVFQQEKNTLDCKVRLLSKEIKEGQDPYTVLLEFTASHEPLAATLSVSTLPAQQCELP